MKFTSLPINQQERLKSFDDYYILESIQELDFVDNIQLISIVCGTDANRVCIIDTSRQWFKSIDKNFTLEKISYYFNIEQCKNSNNEISILENSINLSSIPESDKDYIGYLICVPLISLQNKSVFGNICILVSDLHSINTEKKKALIAIARQLVSPLELKRKLSELKEKQTELKNAYSDLEKFSYIASHDIRSPLNNILSITQLLKDIYMDNMPDEGKEYLIFVNDAALQLSEMVNGILEYSKSSQLFVDNIEIVNITTLIEEVKNLLNIPENIKLIFNKNDYFITTSRIAIKQILLNLCDNAIKHSNKLNGEIEIKIDENKSFYIFEIIDNGPGIAEKDQKKIFELFERLDKNKNDNNGMGIGLPIVKRLVEKLGGDVKVKSEIGHGTTFIFTIAK